MATLVFKKTEETISLPDGSPIGPSCEQAGVPFACGNGFCGVCVIKILQGMEHLSPPTEEEIDFLGEEGVKEERLACKCSILSGTVHIDF